MISELIHILAGKNNEKLEAFEQAYVGIRCPLISSHIKQSIPQHFILTHTLQASCWI